MFVRDDCEVMRVGPYGNRYNSMGRFMNRFDAFP
jgi:hypothetical protein